MKIVKITAAGLFLVALAINVKVTLDDPFTMMNEKALAEETTTNGNPSCDSGGPGSLSCSQTWVILGVETSCSVTCATGKYACCYDGWDLEAHCVCFDEPESP